MEPARELGQSGDGLSPGLSLRLGPGRKGGGKRGLSSDGARRVRQQGHDDALYFARLIGMEHDYLNGPQAKKDVVDPSGDTHSVKSGARKWQVFLYGLGRFRNDDGFTVMNGMGDLLKACIGAFPDRFEDYLHNKQAAKDKLRPFMRAIAEKLQDKRRLRAFFHKSMFNGGEVDYLTVKHEDIYHVFWNRDVIDGFGEHLIVENSQARARGQTPEQKVIFKYKGLNLAELEMRNDSEVHYREIRFNMIKARALDLLFTNIPKTGEYSSEVWLYGTAAKRFGRWKQKQAKPVV